MRDISKKNRSNWNWWKNILVQSIEDTEKFYSCLLGGIDEIASVVASYTRRPPAFVRFTRSDFGLRDHFSFMLSLIAQNQ